MAGFLGAPQAVGFRKCLGDRGVQPSPPARQDRLGGRFGEQRVSECVAFRRRLLIGDEELRGERFAEGVIEFPLRQLGNSGKQGVIHPPPNYGRDPEQP